MAEKFGASIAGGATSSVLTLAGGGISYMVEYKNIIKELKFKVEKLEAARVDIQELIKVSRNNNEVTRRVVTDWLKKVGTILERAWKLMDEATKLDKSIAGFLRVDPTRISVAKRASKKIKQIQELLDERSLKVGDSKPFQSLELVSFGDFEAFTSREVTTNKIIKALREERIVGVFGMPGVGKTELMGAIARRAKEETLFDEVVKVTVSQNPDIGRIQKDIAKQLGLQLGESSVAVAAVELSNRLKNRGKKVLVAFDDIWKRLDLNEVGIPYRRDTQSNCKVLFTTRSENVCDQMEADVKLEVGVLSEADSWRLFRLKAGDVADSSSHREVAKEVLNKCKGLPLAIVTLGLALRNKDIIVWLDARTRLKRSMYKDMDRVITIVKLSYDFFHNDKAAQMCFLFCSLFPEDFRINTDVLLSYIQGEELLGKEDNMEEARKRLHTIVDKLTSSGMLLRMNKDYVMMHDIIRDAAICIASDAKEGEGFIVKSGLGLKEWPPIDREMDKCRRLSLMENNLSFSPPPYQITAPLLLTLSLSGNLYIEEIPSDFFKEMKHLKALDLSWTSIRSLPESFQCLRSLHTLLMDDCHELTDISLVGDLKMLEILSIGESYEVQIPGSLQKLTNLKMLNACDVKSQFPSRVISSLHRLEELYLDSVITGIATTELDFQEVASLTRLTCLQIRLPVECMLNVFPSHWKNLCDFSIYVGKSNNENKIFPGTRMLSLALGSSNQNWVPVQLSNWVGVLLEKIEVLEVYEYGHFLIFEDPNANGYYQDLFHLGVFSCAQLRHLLSTTSTEARKPLFSNLKELDLFELDNFVAICDGPLPEGCLSKLKVLKVQECPRIRTLIPVDLLGSLQILEEIKLSMCEGLEELFEFEGYMSNPPPSSIFPSLRKLDIWGSDKLKCVLPLKAAQDLMQLEELSVGYCSDMEMVFKGDIDDADEGILPRLKTLTLSDLPSLTSFGPQGLIYDFPALVKMGIKNCGRMKKLPLLGKDSIPKLEKLHVDSGWLDGLEWEDQSLMIHLKSLPALDDSPFYL